MIFSVFIVDTETASRGSDRPIVNCQIADDESVDVSDQNQLLNHKIVEEQITVCF